MPDGVHPVNEGQDTLALIFYRALTAVPTSADPGRPRPRPPAAREAGPRSISATLFRWLSGYRGVDGRKRPQ
jgi:hypothetical protein